MTTPTNSTNTTSKIKKLSAAAPPPTAPVVGATNAGQQVFHEMVGPGVGLMDRVRDKLTGRTTP
jgi:hypothetical protein